MVDNNESSCANFEFIACLCVEYWKLAKASHRAAHQLPEKECKRLLAQVKFSELQLVTVAKKMGMSLIAFDGESFKTGMPVSADNSEDFSDDEDLIVMRTIEPAVVKSTKVIRNGRAIIGKRHSNGQEE